MRGPAEATLLRGEQGSPHLPCSCSFGPSDATVAPRIFSNPRSVPQRCLISQGECLAARQPCHCSGKSHGGALNSPTSAGQSALTEGPSAPSPVTTSPSKAPSPSSHLCSAGSRQQPRTVTCIPPLSSGPSDLTPGCSLDSGTPWRDPGPAPSAAFVVGRHRLLDLSDTATREHGHASSIDVDLKE